MHTTENPETCESTEVIMETHEHDCGEEHPATSRFGHLYGYIVTGLVSLPLIGGAAHMVFHMFAHAFGLPCP